MPGYPKVSTRPRVDGGSGALSAAEAVIVAEVLAGHSNAEIARRLGKGVGTVKNQLSAAFRKLGVASRTKLMAQAIRPGRSAAK